MFERTWTKPWTPAALSSSICSLGLPATTTGTWTAGADFAGRSRGIRRRTSRARSGPHRCRRSSRSLRSKSRRSRRSSGRRRRAPFIFTSPRFSSSTLESAGGCGVALGAQADLLDGPRRGATRPRYRHGGLGELFFRDIGIVVDADQGAAAGGDGLFLGGARRRDGGVDRRRGSWRNRRRPRPAGRASRPRGRAIGERFDVVGAAGRVGHACRGAPLRGGRVGRCGPGGRRSPAADDGEPSQPPMTAESDSVVARRRFV